MKTVELGPIGCSWMESMCGCSNSEEEIDETGNRKQVENIKLGPIDYSWMESMGCMSDIEEEEIR